MKFVKVDELPKTVYKRNTLLLRRSVLAKLLEFLDSGYNIARVDLDPGEYKSFDSAYTALKQAVKYNRLHGIKVASRQGKIYLVRIL